MDPLTIIIVTTAFAALIGLAFLSGHELGRKNGLTRSAFASATWPTSASRDSLSAKTAAHPATEEPQMSIRPSVIDRRGEQPCLPANALLAVCERLAEGGTVTLRRQRIAAALAQLRARLCR
jgi:hypothetical protein